ncbi:beta-L-arabinofuranosidase domain-containing protein [Bacteroides caecicola]|uniref:beta-L-arabinofuranosidase domain-containing protein n=1 Tax=Bacteroides caecicola TaxID=1462569 RepID=UPI0020132B11|nr:beta-L-arabinofuranosidase domain-containing protein [Bacteroides caecicola]MCL1624558.1 glycoside hydrolase family 127 protein [Bacteroides caecicola]
MKNISKVKGMLFCAALSMCCSCNHTSTEFSVTMTDRPDRMEQNPNYANNRSPLQPSHFLKLPVGSIKPEGWLRKYLELQRDGLTGHLNEISAWLEKENNAWLTNGGDHGWEEVPYWLKGYGNLAYILGDENMINEAKTWIEAAINSQRPDGSFGPINMKGDKPELWAQMIMLWCLQSYYEYTNDSRVLTLMTNFFKWELSLPDDKFLEDYWENSRGGDNLLSVYWLYNKTGESFLLELAEKIHRNTADWTRSSTLPNWHNVNVAQCFREPATYYMLDKDSALLAASYNVHHLIRRTFGQVPGGMFGSDENCRMGYIDPRQGVETCGMVEQMASDEIMLRMTGDPFWAEHCEDVAFNTYPAATMPDFKALRYITCPNHVISDSKNHHPGIDNSGPFLAMNPFSSRCCQHNHAQGWPYYTEHLVLATPDNGAALALYASCKATMKVGDGQQIAIHEETNYPFDEVIRLTVQTDKEVEFPLYLRIPTWANQAQIHINGQKVTTPVTSGQYACIRRTWKNDDKVELTLPMQLSLRTWQVNKNSVSVNYGPLTMSLKIREKYVKSDSKETAIGDSQWQKDADASQWPTYEIYPDSPWNYSLVLNKDNALKDFKVIKKQWPADNFPFTQESVPLEIKTVGRQIPSWKVDQYGLCHELPEADAPKREKEEITLIPMGAARLRISAFPNTYE